MPAASTIVVVAPDPGLRRSLEFALEVEGYSVDSHELLPAASPIVDAAACVIVDDSAIRSGSAEFQSLKCLASRVILLVDGLGSAVDIEGFTVLTKPVEGSDLIDLVRVFAARRLLTD